MITIDEEYTIQARRLLHRRPELSGREFETAAYIEGELDKLGISHERKGGTGVLGVLRRGEGKTILLRADTDALPVTEETGAAYASQSIGAAHVCGHDGHTAALLGAAKALAAADFSGAILFVFQNAEEFGHGSKYFPGVAKQADRAFGVHVTPRLPVGTVGVNSGAAAAACDYFKVVVRGKGGHITRPEQGQDALRAASRLALELPAITARLLSPFETALVGVGKLNAGVAFNVIADYAELEGTIRSFSKETHELLKAEIARLSALCGGEAAFEHFIDPLINDEEAAREVLEAASGIANAVALDEPGLGLAADDFEFYLRETKGAYAYVGTSNETNPNTREPLHSPRFDIDERGVLIAARLHAAYAMKILGGQP